MPTESMKTFLEAKLCTCIIKRTSVRESGLTVSTKELPGETILFFQTDSSEGRRRLAMVEEGVKVCDYLVFYTIDGEVKEIICFLELKGKKINMATEQIISTFDHFLALKREIVAWRKNGQLTCKACVCLHGQAPRGGQQYENLLIERFGKGNVRIKHGSKYDLGTFLRQKSR